MSPVDLAGRGDAVVGRRMIGEQITRDRCDETMS